MKRRTFERERRVERERGVDGRAGKRGIDME